MKPYKLIVGFLAITFGVVSSGFAGVVLDDTWADGTRTDQNLPTESAWYSSSGGSLTATTGSMSLAVPSGAIFAVTYFTTNAAVPISLNVGDTLQATIGLTFSGVAAQNSSQGFRLGLFDFADSTLSPKRVTSDGSLSGNNGLGNGVQGYALFQNMGTAFNSSNPMGILKRTNLADSGLLGTSGDWTSLTNGPGSTSGFPGFASGTNYVLQLTLQRTGTNSLTFTISWLNTGNGATLSTSVTDSNATSFNFDGIALRPSGAGSAASTITFKEVKVELIPGATPPFINSDPQDQTVFAGQSAVFSVVAGGTAPLTYQWYSNGNPLSANAINSTLTFANVQPSDAGDYSVLVANAYGSVTSDVATLTVSVPAAPSIVTQPQDQVVLLGQTAVFAVDASGTEPLSYQWYYNSSMLLTNAIDDTLTITNVQVANTGSYSVIVSNLVGSAVSSNAVLSVNTNSVAPIFTTQPASLVVLVGDAASFTAAAVGTDPISYQWNKGNGIIPGATNPTLALTGVQLADAGNYTVLASNSIGVTISEVATLTVGESLAGDIYVSPNGTDADPGTLAQPTSLAKAIVTVEAGHTIYIRGGTYTYSAQITIARANMGTGPTQRKHILAYVTPQGVVEKPVLDFSTEPYGKTSSVSNPRGIEIDGHYWHLRGLEVEGAADNGIYIAGNSNVVELCVVHNNRDSGLQLGRYSSSAARSDWPAGNLILNCDSYNNYDAPPNSGENADGFACKLTTGPGNVFRGCISHNNIDDGWDLYTKTDTGPIDPVVIDQCISYNNGTLTDGTFSSAGDRNGFKLGGEKIPVIHIATRNIAFNNGKNGFTFNSNPAAIRVINNIAFDNVEGNFKFDGAGPLFYNDISLYTTGAGVNDRYGGNSGIATGPSNLFWFKDSSSRGPSINDHGLTVSSASFITLTPPTGGFTRNADGSINLGNFARLVNGSPLINAGQLPPPDVVTQLPYNAASYYEGAPDIGAIEVYLASHNPPVILSDPTSQTVVIGSNVTFTVAVGGSVPLNYQWFKNNQSVGGATNATLFILGAQPTDAGQYFAIASNAVDTATSNVATLNVLSVFQAWQLKHFNCTNCPQADAASDPDGDGINNQMEFLSGSDPANSASGLRILGVVPQNNGDMLITWKTVGGYTNAVQATAGSAGGGYGTNYTDITAPPHIIISGSGDVTTNYIDGGGATNVPSRFYRIRLVP
jgi:hypothetical protein